MGQWVVSSIATMLPLEGCVTQDQIPRPTRMDLDMNRAHSPCTACPAVVHGLPGTEPVPQCLSAGNVHAEGGWKAPI